jgi:hypothetical protein
MSSLAELEIRIRTKAKTVINWAEKFALEAAQVATESFRTQLGLGTPTTAHCTPAELRPLENMALSFHNDYKLKMRDAFLTGAQIACDLLMEKKADLEWDEYYIPRFAIGQKVRWMHPSIPEIEGRILSIYKDLIHALDSGASPEDEAEWLASQPDSPSIDQLFYLVSVGVGDEERWKLSAESQLIPARIEEPKGRKEFAQ